jgi:predicted RNA-binding Zn-ribbon protein involved in translation (DUF1610 family)
MPADDDILDITWDDLKDVPDTPPAPMEVFPALDAADAAVAGGREPWIEVDALCARTRGGFGVRFRQAQPGVFSFASVARKGAGKPGAPGAPPGPARGLGQVNATFSLAGYPGCPYCGRPELIQCDRCGTVMCGSAVRQDKRGASVVCPSCGGRGQVATGVTVTVQGQVGGMKGKPGGKRW